MEKYQGNLKLPSNPGGIAKIKRTESVIEAQQWPAGTIENKRYRKVYESGDFGIFLGKPGKEAAESYVKRNVHDMTPTVFHKGAAVAFLPTFEDIFRDLWHLGLEASKLGSSRDEVLEMVGALLYRSSYMLDHIKEEASGLWVWSPPSDTVSPIVQALGVMGRELQMPNGTTKRLPIDVYLQLVDALALNEDVKYQSENVEKFSTVKSNTGRTNTMQTCTSMIAVFLERYDIVKLFGSLSRSRGVAPMSQTDAKVAFPVLA